MFAFLAAVDFLVVLIFKPATDVDLVVLGFLLISLHLAFGTFAGELWRGRRTPS